MTESPPQDESRPPREGAEGPSLPLACGAGGKAGADAGGGERREAAGGGDKGPREGPASEDRGPGQAGSESEAEALGQRLRTRLHEDQELALWMRALLFLVGWLLVLLGVAGLVLPGIQGIITLVAGAAVLSLASELAYKALRWCFRVWPRGWRRVARWRLKLRRKLVRYGGAKGPRDPGDGEAGAGGEAGSS